MAASLRQLGVDIVNKAAHVNRQMFQAKYGDVAGTDPNLYYAGLKSAEDQIYAAYSSIPDTFEGFDLTSTDSANAIVNGLRSIRDQLARDPDYSGNSTGDTHIDQRADQIKGS